MTNNLKTMPMQVSKTIADMIIAENKLDKDYKEAKTLAHETLWAKVHEENPELDEDGKFRLNTRYADQGIVMLDVVVEEEDGESSLIKLLRGLS